MSGPRLGRKASDPDLAEAEKKVEYQDNTDRIAVERSFSLSKRCYKMGLVMEYLDDTVHTAVSTKPRGFRLGGPSVGGLSGQTFIAIA